MASRGLELVKRLPKDGDLIGIEIGVRYGKNAKQILDTAPNIKTLYLIDPWAKPPEGDSYYNSGDGIADRPPGYWKKCYRDFSNRMKPYQDRIEIMRMTSDKAWHEIPAIKFDFIFIDGDHSYEGVKNDIMLYYPRLKKGGIMGGHDYDHPRIGQVRKAVDEMFEGMYELGGDMTWFVRKE